MIDRLSRPACRTRRSSAAGRRLPRRLARAPGTGVPDPDRGHRRRPRAGDARRLRRPGSATTRAAATAPARRSAGSPAATAIDRLRAEHRHRLDRPPGRRDRLPGRALRAAAWPGDADGVHRRVRRRTLFGVDSGDAAVRRPRHRDRPAASPPPRPPRRSATVPVLDASPGLHRPRRSAQHRRPAGHRRPGRVFPGLDRRHHPDRSRPSRRRRSPPRPPAARPTARPRLVVLPTGTGVLAWEVVVVGADAASESAARPLLRRRADRRPRRRPAGVERGRASSLPGRLAAPARRASPTRTASRSPARTRSAATSRRSGCRTSSGVELTDTTTAGLGRRPAHRRGPDLRRLGGHRTTTELPGTLVTSPSTTIIDADAIAAQAYSHKIVDYYESLGRDSWDDKGGPAGQLGALRARQTTATRSSPATCASRRWSTATRASSRASRSTRTFVEPDVAGARGHPRRHRDLAPGCSTPASRAPSTRASPTTSATSSAT